MTAFKYIDAYDASGTIYTLYSFCIMGFLMCIHFHIKINSNLISNQTSEIPDVIIHSHSEESNRISSSRRGNHVSCRRESDDNNNNDNEDGNSPPAAVQSLNSPNLHYTPDCERRHNRLLNVRWVSNPLYDSIQIIPYIISQENSEFVSPYAISEPLY